MLIRKACLLTAIACCIADARSGTSISDNYSVFSEIRGIHAIRLPDGKWQPFNTGVRIGVAQKGGAGGGQTNVDIVIDAARANLKFPACAKRFSLPWNEYRRSFATADKRPVSGKLWTNPRYGPDEGQVVRIGGGACEVSLTIGYPAYRRQTDYPGLSQSFFQANFKTQRNSGAEFMGKHGRITFTMGGAAQSFEFLVEQLGY